MKIYKVKEDAAIYYNDAFYVMNVDNWDRFLNRENLFEEVKHDIKELKTVENYSLPDTLNTPMGNQEIWASGVTYMRSREARMEESKKAGGGSFYDRVYDADRPELFSKLRHNALSVMAERFVYARIQVGTFRNLNSPY